jgi:predicted nucleotidyltransferase component of viral defense system
LDPKKIQYNVKKEYRKIAVSGMQTKQEMLIYDTLLILDKSGLLDLLQLKGGHCARCHLDIKNHRYSNDLDFNVLEPKEQNVKRVNEALIKVFNKFCEEKKLQSIVSEKTDESKTDNSIVVLSRAPQTGRITNSVLIEINKRMPYLTVEKKIVKTFLDLDRVGFEEVAANVFTIEELLGEKLYICGRGNGHRDAYDIYIFTEENKNYLSKLPKITIDRFIQRCEMDDVDPKKFINDNKKAIVRSLNKTDKIDELKKMAFQPISSQFIRVNIRSRVCKILDLILK